MSFNSLEFAVFLPVVFILYWLVGRNNKRFQNVLIVISSYVFYAWWDWRFLSLIVLSTLVDYGVGIGLAQYQKDIHRKRLLWLSLIVNLGLLMVFKYFNFFLGSLNHAFSVFGCPVERWAIHIILPVGISFYTFQTLSYSIDVYKRKLTPTRDFMAFAAFVCFFPQLVAGPIERARRLLPQFSKPRTLKFIHVQYGFLRILVGLFKKVVIADRLAIAVNTVYNDPAKYGGIHYMVATIFFAFQIYCDFSGYSDIAIGTARLFDVKLMENFRMPYLSTSIRQFWRRWHVSLSTWLRDYVYIPLGGNRVGRSRFYFNLFFVFLISGLWHGAKWTFIFWGAIHGFLMIAEYFITIKLKCRTFSQKWSVLSTISTFLIIGVTWIFFRANSFSDAIYIFTHLFDFSRPLRIMGKYLGMPVWMMAGSLLLIIILVLYDVWLKKRRMPIIFLIRCKPLIRWAIYSFMILAILIFGNFDIHPFIYFQF